MQGKRAQDMFTHIQGRFVWQISPPLQTLRACRLWPLAALRPRENPPGFPAKSCLASTHRRRAEWRKLMGSDPSCMC